jgi:hypothetical protein
MRAHVLTNQINDSRLTFDYFLLLSKNKDPDMMREAQKMMNDPAFQARMKQITERPEFKESMEKTQEMMKDENKVSDCV